MPEKSIPGGYILLSRKLIDSEIYDKPPLYLKVWIYLLSKAQHSNYKKLKRGQLFTNIPEIQEACSWYVGYRKETPSKSQIFRIIDWLRKTGERKTTRTTNEKMIRTTKATQGMVIEVCNYNYYQDPENYEQNAERNNEKTTNKQRPQHSRNNINKNVKNDNNDNNNICPKTEIGKIYQSILGEDKHLFKDYIQIYRNQNKTGKITDSKHLRLLKELYQIYQNMEFKFDGQEYGLNKAIFKKGIEKIIDKDIDNLNYAKKVWIGEIERNKNQPGKKRKIKKMEPEDEAEFYAKRGYR